MIKILAILGLLVSAYSFIVFKSKNKKRFCDINKNISCSKALRSVDGKIFGFHNSILGVFYYVSIFLLSLLNFKGLLIAVSFLAVCFSVFLAYKLIKKRNFCLVCILSYIVNILIFLSIIK